MSSITDHFKVGDKVEWIHVKFLKGTYDVLTHTGTIEEITGSTARVKSPDYEQDVNISLFQLMVIEEAPNA